MSANDEKPPWEVLVIGGASGTGKTSASYPIARRFGVALTEIDDLHITARRLTTPAEQPVLHYWFMHPEAATEMSPEAIVEMQISVSRAMAPAVTAVIANHIETQMPVVLEGDYVLPELV